MATRPRPVPVDLIETGDQPIATNATHIVRAQHIHTHTPWARSPQGDTLAIDLWDSINTHTHTLHSHQTQLTQGQGPTHSLYINSHTYTSTQIITNLYWLATGKENIKFKVIYLEYHVIIIYRVGGKQLPPFIYTLTWKCVAMPTLYIHIIYTHTAHTHTRPCRPLVVPNESGNGKVGFPAVPSTRWARTRGPCGLVGMAPTHTDTYLHLHRVHTH